VKTIIRLLMSLSILGTAIAAETTPAPAGPRINLLVISKTAGYRHQVIPTGIKTLVEIAQEAKWGVTATEDTSLVTPEFLGHFDVVVFLMTTKAIFTPEEKAAIEAFVKGGKGVITIHTGADTEYEWPWYNRQLGAKFLGHPPAQKARLVIEDRSHPATSFFPAAEWVTTDEWYSFDRDPRPDVHVLISIDESSYNVDDNRWFAGAKQRMGDHPLVWWTLDGKGRVFQTALGHTEEMWADPLYRAHLKGAIEWTAGLK
jgi:type 1 glutamine amidotransferase